MAKNFERTFIDALSQLEVDAKEVGETLTSICRETKISRATPDRWRKTVPKSVVLLGQMQDIVTAKKKRMDEEARTGLHHD